MRNFGGLILILAMLASFPAQARGTKWLIELDHQIVGPGWKTWSLRLESSGKVVEESYDWSSKRYHQVKTRCKLTEAESLAATNLATTLVDSLPSTVDAGRPVPIDGPNKRIAVRRANRIQSSSWFFPEDSTPSTEAQEFARKWQQIETLLACPAHG
jgi:hypothetical protein